MAKARLGKVQPAITMSRYQMGVRDAITGIENYKRLLTDTKWKVIKSDEAEHDDSIIKFRTHGSRDGLQAKVINNNGESSGWYTACVRADGEISFFSDASTTWEGTVGVQGQYISFNLQEMYAAGDTGYTMKQYTGAVIFAPVGGIARQPTFGIVFP